MSQETSPIRELRISAVQNGLIVIPRGLMHREGYDSSCYVFQTVEQLTAWMLKQTWETPGLEHG